jgi:hypothetical protein
MASTTSGLYICRRGSFPYVVSWELCGRIVKWTAIVRGGADSCRLLVGEIEASQPEAGLRALVRSQVEERIDRAGWLE